MGIPAAPQITRYCDFVESVCVKRPRVYKDRFEAYTETVDLTVALLNANALVEQDLANLTRLPSRVDFLLSNRASLLTHLESYADAVLRASDDEPALTTSAIGESVELTADDVRARLEQLRGEMLLLDRTHVLMDRHLRESMVEHHFDFTQAESYHITEYPKANTWFYRPLFPLYTAYFEQPTPELLSEYSSTARELQASEHPLLGDSEFARVFSLAPELREQTSAILDELTAAELMGPLLTNDRVTK